ncbi:hypothetical protein M413DRAFT_440118, partial [Hebeloma cylindrosporum]
MSEDVAKLFASVWKRPSLIVDVHVYVEEAATLSRHLCRVKLSEKKTSSESLFECDGNRG